MDHSREWHVQRTRNLKPIDTRSRDDDALRDRAELRARAHAEDGCWLNKNKYLSAAVYTLLFYATGPWDNV